MVDTHVFICGCPRSGTTFLTSLLNEHSDVAIGIERYGNLFFDKPLTPILFKTTRFYDMQAGDTFYRDLSFDDVYGRKRENFHNLRIIGDKIPLLYRHFDSLNTNFEHLKIIFCLRNIFDVAASYEARASDPTDDTWDRNKGTKSAIQDWNESLVSFHRWISKIDLFLFDYDGFYGDPDSQMASLASWLGVDWSDDMIKKVKNAHQWALHLEGLRPRSLKVAAVRDICMKSNLGLYRKAVKMATKRT